MFPVKQTQVCILLTLLYSNILERVIYFELTSMQDSIQYLFMNKSSLKHQVSLERKMKTQVKQNGVVF